MKIRNYVQKNLKLNGGGVHVDKTGKHVPRYKQKAKFKKEMKEYVN